MNILKIIEWTLSLTCSQLPLFPPQSKTCILGVNIQLVSSSKRNDENLVPRCRGWLKCREQLSPYSTVCMWQIKSLSSPIHLVWDQSCHSESVTVIATTSTGYNSNETKVYQRYFSWKHFHCSPPFTRGLFVLCPVKSTVQSRYFFFKKTCIMSSENYKERYLLFIRWLPWIVRRSTLPQRVYSSNDKKRFFF